MAKAVYSKRNHLASILIIFLGLLFLLTIIGLNLINPLDTHAHPQYGFTPQPPPTPRPTPTGNDPGQDGDDDEDNDDDQPAPHQVTVQIEGCNLSCSTGATLASASTSQNNNVLAQAAGPGSIKPVSSEMLAHVQLIHQGSGWIAEGTISDSKAVSFRVPYPGQWYVFLIDEPEFATGESLDLTGADVEALQTGLAHASLLLGVVEANTTEPQRVACPLDCPMVNFLPAPAAMPQSGAATPSRGPLFVMIGGVGLCLLGFLLYKTNLATLD